MSAMKSRKGHADTKDVKKKSMSSTQGKGVQESGEKKHKMKPAKKVAKPKK